MTGFFIDLTEPKKRALIASDTLSYTVTGDRHRPLGFASKVIPFPHLRGALIGSGIYEIQVAAAATLMGRPELLGFDDVLDALPGILRAETGGLAAERGIFETETMMLFAAGWCGWNDTEGRFELVMFENYGDNYAPQRGAKGLVGIPNVPASYVSAGFNQIADPAVRAMAGLRAIARFTAEHGDDFGMAPLGGEVVLSELRPDGISSKVVGRLDGFEQLGEEIAATWEDVYSGADLGGVELVNRTGDREAAMKKFEALARRTAPAAPDAAAAPASLTRQQRRALAKRERKATTRRAA